MASVKRQLPLPLALALLAAVLAAAILITRTRTSAGTDPASPHAQTAGFEPSAENVSAEITSRLHSATMRVESNPADTAALLELARLLHDAHRPQEAAISYAKYLEANPGNREAWFDLADSYGRAGDWPAALRVMQSVLEREPDDPAALYNLGVIELQLGNAPAARAWWEKAGAQERDPGTAQRAREALAGLDKGR